MVALIGLLIVFSLSILITRIATIALTYTGLSKEASRFQARSAFTGVGFTTSESEKVVGQKVVAEQKDIVQEKKKWTQRGGKAIIRKAARPEIRNPKLNKEGYRIFFILFLNRLV